jgi:hypothetical protein
MLWVLGCNHPLSLDPKLLEIFAVLFRVSKPVGFPAIAALQKGGINFKPDKCSTETFLAHGNHGGDHAAKPSTPPAAFTFGKTQSSGG